MKHLVFVLGSYYPNSEAVGICARQVIEHLKDEYHVTVIAIRGGIEQDLKCTIDGVDIIRIETRERRLRLFLMASTKRFHRILLFCLRAAGALKRLTSHVTIDRPLVESYIQALESLEGSTDVIIPLSFPFESVLAAIEFKRRRPITLVCPYLFDNFVDSASLHVHPWIQKMKKGRHIALEKDVVNSADAVLAMHPLRAHIDRHFDLSKLEWVYFLEHPLLSPPLEVDNTPSASEVRLVYTGSLIRNVRDPKYLIELLHLLAPKQVLTIDFYVMGNLANSVETFTDNRRLKITNHGAVNKEAAAFEIMTSQILINLGEARGKQISSKVFEYMATGKPIIHLACVDDDADGVILSKYPLALCLTQDSARIKANALKISNFIDLHKDSHVPYAEVAGLFPEALPATTADLMRDLFAKGVR